MMSIPTSIWKGVLCTEAAGLIFAIGVLCVHLAASLLGLVGASAQGIDTPAIDLPSLLKMFVVLVFVLAATSVPTGVALGAVAGRLRRYRRRVLLVAAAACLVLQAFLAAYPFAAFSAYFFSNTPPTEPFPWGADWDVPWSIVFVFGYVALLGYFFLLGPLLVAAIWVLERWTASDPSGPGRASLARQA